jgi:hypothetical protein
LMTASLSRARHVKREIELFLDSWIESSISIITILITEAI